MATAPSFARTLLTTSKQAKLFTLVIPESGGKVLLGLKKKGFGQGYYNGFGGKVETTDESIEHAAHRELHEEAGITATSLHQRGILTFAFDDQPLPWEVHVFHVSEFTGEPTESDEMKPLWLLPEEIPYEKMWADDIHWYPLFLRGAKFQGVFAFKDTHTLVWHNLLEVEEIELSALQLLETQ